MHFELACRMLSKQRVVLQSLPDAIRHLKPARVLLYAMYA